MRRSRRRRALLGALALLVLSFACATSTATPTPKTVVATPTSTPRAEAAWVPSTQAAAYYGKRTTVCGPVVDTRYATGSKGQPTFLNFDRAYPNHTFVVVVWGSERARFPSGPEAYYKGKNVCATGLVESYQGKPQIVARDASQLRLQ